MNQPSPLPTCCTPASPLVLDTNTVLAWLLFKDPLLAPLAQGLSTAQWRWVTTPWMLAELRSVLQRPLPPRWEDARKHALTCDFESMAEVRGAPSVGEGLRLWCSDPNDQPFIDAALAWSATALLTRDRALLKLARRAARHGVAVARPEAWPPAAPRA